MDGGRPTTATTCTEKRQPMRCMPVCDRDRIGRHPQISFRSPATEGDQLLTAPKLWLLSGVALPTRPMSPSSSSLFSSFGRDRNGDMDMRREGGCALTLPSPAEQGSASEVVRRLLCDWYIVWLSASSSWRI
jgi:hypothetical protein